MNVFSLFAKIGLDTKDYESGLKESKSKFHDFADGLKGAAGKVGDVLAGIGKAAAAGVGAASTALTALTKQSVDAVANYEQLVGGVDKIFGESSKKVQEYANKAYSEAGLSANQYMEAVTNFSASLLQSLDGDTEAAADAANRAIIDMSDNMNTYGSSMESVMNAYQGFSKQNYTMLDNLKLGYGGTKEEMQRLIQDASQMNEEMQKLGVTVDADSLSFGNIVNAISVMQERMKIAGTTHNEAAKTISGSLASMKAAWQNFLTGTGSAAQFTEALKSSIGNIKNNLSDIIPRLTTGLTELVDQIAPEIPPIIEQTLPAIIDGASSLITGLAGRIPDLLVTILPSLADGTVKVVKGLWDILPQIGALIIDLAKQAVGYLDKNMNQIVGSITETVVKILEWVTDPKKITGILQAAVRLITSFVEALWSPQCLNKLLEAAPAIIGGIVEGFTDALPALLDGLGKIVGAIVDWFTGDEADQHLIDLLDAAIKILTVLGESMWNQLSIITGKVWEIAEKIADAFGIGDYWRAGKDAMDEFGRGLADGFEEVQKSAINYGSWIWELLHPTEAWLARQEQMLAEQNRTDFLTVFGDQTESSTPNNLAEYYQQQGTAQENPAANILAMFTYTGEKKKAEVPNNLAEYYEQKYRHATGFYANRPAWLRNDVVGEAGDEVLLPLDSNTGWMDKLADKLGEKMTGGNVINITINAESSAPEDIRDAVVEAIDEKLSNLQTRQYRGIGMAWGGHS